MKGTTKLKETFDLLWDQIGEFLPTFLLGVLILIVGWIIAKIISKLVLKLLTRTKDSKLAQYLNLDDISERLNIELNLPVIISKVLYWMIILFFVVAASETFGWHNVSLEISSFIKYLPKILSALLIFVVGYAIASFLRTAIKSVAKSAGMGLGNFLGEVLFYFLVLIVSITALSQAGFNTNLISSHMYIIVAAVAITVAISVGLGSRELVSDLLKNYYNKGILEEGDKISYKDLKGTVSQISKTSIVIETEKEKHIIPAKDFYASTYKIEK